MGYHTVINPYISELKPKKIIFSIIRITIKLLIYSLYFIVYFVNHLEWLFDLIYNQKNLYLNLTDAIVGFLLVFAIVEIIDSVRELVDFKKKNKRSL